MKNFYKMSHVLVSTLKPIMKKCFYSDCNKYFISNDTSTICPECIDKNKPQASNKCFNINCNNLFIDNRTICPKCYYGVNKPLILQNK